MPTRPVSQSSGLSFGRSVGRSALVCLVAALLTGCVSSDLLRRAQREFNRAARIEDSGVFYEPILAKVGGNGEVPPIPPEARQHYLGVIANMELVGPTGRQELRRDGQLGNAFALRLLAEWRLGRLEAARQSLHALREAGQEPTDQRLRALVAAFAGVIRIEDALDAAATGEPFARTYEIIAGPDGAWRALGAARMETARAGRTPPQLLETRLAAFKVLRDAYARVPPDTPLDEAMVNAWRRARAEAQIELAEFASLAPGNAAAHARRVRHWQELCGLDPVTR